MRRLFGVDRRDTRWLQDRLRHPADRGQEPAWGMFNPGQKLLAWAPNDDLLTSFELDGPPDADPHYDHRQDVVPCLPSP